MTNHVLLIEDVEVAQKAAKQLLEGFGFVVDIAKTGQEAVDALATRNNYVLVLIDLGLPDLHGLKIAEKIREKERESNAKEPLYLVALTVHDDDEYKAAVDEYGMNCFIKKPLNNAHIEQLIRTINERKPLQKDD